MNTNREVVGEGSKICRKCKIEKSLDKFYKSKKTSPKGVESYCINCRKEVNRKNYRESYNLIVLERTEKRCSKCNLIKPIEDFAPNPETGVVVKRKCKKCRLKTKTQVNKEKPEKIRSEIKQRHYETALKSYEKNGGKNNPRIREASLKRHYNITLADYNKMFADQEGVCAICFKPEAALFKETLRHLAVDHNHKTGEIRSLLCGNCNKLIGLAHEEEQVLRNAIQYLSKYNNE